VRGKRLESGRICLTITGLGGLGSWMHGPVDNSAGGSRVLARIGP
jgi:hypothetical protein